MTEARAGWYPDPGREFTYRYFDGAAWTAHVARGGSTVESPPPYVWPPPAAHRIVPGPDATPPVMSTSSPSAAGPAATRKVGVLPAWVWAIVLVGVIALLAVVGSSDDTTRSRTAGRTANVDHVLYEVTGSASGVDLTVSNGNGGTMQYSDKAVPLCNRDTGECGVRFTARPGSFLYLSAQNTGESGTITCRISADGVVVDEATSSGAYVIASCSGRAP